MRAAGVNFPDVLLSYGKYQFKPMVPFVPGGEAAGVVHAVGSGVTTLVPGDRVAATLIYGAFAERIVVPELAAVKLPADGQLRSRRGNAAHLSNDGSRAD